MGWESVPSLPRTPHSAPGGNSSALEEAETHFRLSEKKPSKPSNTLPSTVPSMYVLLPLLKGYGFPINERLSLVLMSDTCLYQQEGTHLSPPSAVRGSLWFAVLA